MEPSDKDKETESEKISEAKRLFYGKGQGLNIRDGDQPKAQQLYKQLSRRLRERK